MSEEEGKKLPQNEESTAAGSGTQAMPVATGLRAAEVQNAVNFLAHPKASTRAALIGRPQALDFLEP